MNQPIKPLVAAAYLLDAVMIVLGTLCLTYDYLSDGGIGHDAWLHIFAGFSIGSAISMLLDYLSKSSAN